MVVKAKSLGTKFNRLDLLVAYSNAGNDAAENRNRKSEMKRKPALRRKRKKEGRQTDGEKEEMRRDR